MISTKIIYLERKSETDYSNKKAIEEAILSFPVGKRLELRVKILSQRSDRQNRYYWQLVHIIANHIGHTKEETHEIIKFKFLKREAVDEATGELFEYLESTAKLSKEEFGEFITSLQHWSATALRLPLPNPGEDLEMPFDDNNKPKK